MQFNSDKALEAVKLCQAMANDKGKRCCVVIGGYGQLLSIPANKVRGETVLETCSPVTTTKPDVNQFMTLKQVCQMHGFASVKSTSEALGVSAERLKRWQKTNMNLLLSALTGLRERRTI